MSDNIIDIFDRYGDGTNIKGRSSLPKKPKQPYQCCETSDSRQMFLRLHMHYEATVLMPYAYLTEAFLYQDENRIDLLYENINQTEVIVGSNLGSLLELIQDQQLRSIQSFIENRHRQPKEGEPVVMEIHGLTLVAYNEAMVAAQKRAAEDSAE